MKFAEGTATIKQDAKLYTVATLDFTPLVVFAYPTTAYKESNGTTKEFGVELSYREKAGESWKSFVHTNTATPMIGDPDAGNGLQIAVKPAANYYTSTPNSTVKWFAMGV